MNRQLTMRGRHFSTSLSSSLAHSSLYLLKYYIGIYSMFLSSLVLAQATHGGNFLDLSELQVELSAANLQPAQQCTTLVEQSDPNFSIISATVGKPNDNTPAICIIHGFIKPKIQFVLKLPDTWNQRIYMHGNGGYGGQSVTGAYGTRLSNPALQEGFATLFTDTGHNRADGHNASWAYNDLEKEVDYGFRAVHLSIETAKRLIKTYYSKPATYSYFDGCSGGGRQGLVAAQRFPDDFDGIAVGAPFYDLAGILMQYWHNQKALAVTPLSPEKVVLLGNIIMDKFDDLDGLKDGVISNPLAIDFKPARDLPRDKNGQQGFTRAELETLTKLYSGPRLQGNAIAPGIVIGAELAGKRDAGRTADKSPRLSPWNSRLYPDISGYNQQLDILIPWLRYMAFNNDDPEFDWTKLDMEKDWSRMQPMSAIFNADNPDLHDYKNRGGKLLMYHGWSDIGVSPIMTVQYYEEVMRTMGSVQTQSFFRTFMIPGMFHCNGGRNVDRFDTMTNLINWVEAGIMPESITASSVENDQITRTRPLCPYPQVARYKGEGDINQAENFKCVTP
ncbi:MAG: tannase/feruloyl esterase family alpha/beta hydrolase [Gammaproteobacteria bacterium]|jgi:hypothetical protein|nr:tannase/feruloyl esterase family alpha/beta hydrolase [Gammaproteobacteria bacterium]